MARISSTSSSSDAGPAEAGLGTVRGSVRWTAIAARATTMAPASAATPMPSTNACFAASTTAPPPVPSPRATPKAPTRPVRAAAVWLSVSPAERVADGRRVGRRDERAEDGHAEGAAELAGGVVHGRADAGLAERHRRHDQRGERRHGDAPCRWPARGSGRTSTRSSVSTPMNEKSDEADGDRGRARRARPGRRRSGRRASAPAGDRPIITTAIGSWNRPDSSGE